MKAIELFPCSGGMAEGFRRAGVRFTWAFDWDPDACASYGANLGHAPIRLDVRQLTDMVRGGWAPHEALGGLDLLVADPPCTPWSRAGKRKGLADERDMLRETVDLIRLLRPRAYLIGNVPGLEDAPSWKALQKVLAPLRTAGYCILDFAVLDAADYGVPQHRVRPFWFGHLDDPCIRWPQRTHDDPARLATATLVGVEPLRPWVTCRQALGHLPPEDLGRPVRLRWRAKDHENHAPSSPDAPAINRQDEPSFTVCAKDTGGAQGAKVMAWPWDRPSTTICADDRIPPPGHHEKSFLSAPGRAKRPPSTKGPQWSRAGSPDEPSSTVLTDAERATSSSPKLAWPWPRPATTVCAGIDKIAPASEHGGQFGPNAIVLSERAAAILQGFPEGWTFSGKTKRSRWAQIGMAMPPPLAHAVACSVVAQLAAARERVA